MLPLLFLGACHSELPDEWKAWKIIKEYAEGLDGLTKDECQRVGFDEASCTVLTEVLGKGEKGIVTSEEKERLKGKFSDEFIGALTDSDGGAPALQVRARWLAENAVSSIWRWDADSNDRVKMLLELKEMGTHAHEVVFTIAEALTDRNEEVRVAANQALDKIVNVDGQTVSQLARLIDLLN